MTFQKRILLVLVATTACCALGCESLTTGSSAGKKKKKDSGSWFTFKKKEYQVPQSMTVTWSNDILTLAGKPPTRGFGGRFFFYNEKTQAIPVDGDLIVYGFDDTFRKHNGEDLGQAEKRFRFTSEQFTTHFSESELGASYSVWIPWDEAERLFKPSTPIAVKSPTWVFSYSLSRSLSLSLSLSSYISLSIYLSISISLFPSIPFVRGCYFCISVFNIINKIAFNSLIALTRGGPGNFYNSVPL